MCGLWSPTAKKKRSSVLARLFSSLTASSVLSRSGRVPPGCSVTFTAHSKLAWSWPSSPLHIWKQGSHSSVTRHLTFLLIYQCLMVDDFLLFSASTFTKQYSNYILNCQPLIRPFSDTLHLLKHFLASLLALNLRLSPAKSSSKL